MANFYLLPLVFLKFWYFESPVGMIEYFGSFNNYFLKLFALPMSLRTFFKPLKNEYRQGLVGFSIGMGIFVKSILIIFDLVLFSVILCLEVAVILSFLLFPIATFLLFFV